MHQALPVRMHVHRLKLRILWANRSNNELGWLEWHSTHSTITDSKGGKGLRLGEKWGIEQKQVQNALGKEWTKNNMKKNDLWPRKTRNNEQKNESTRVIVHTCVGYGYCPTPWSFAVWLAISPLLISVVIKSPGKHLWHKWNHFLAPVLEYRWMKCASIKLRSEVKIGMSDVRKR